MGAQLRVFRRRIKSVGATKKITKAMELIASSRIVKAQQRVDAALPYTTELLRALSAAAAHSQSGHLFVGKEGEHTRAAMCLITADRGLAGAYSSAAIKEGEALTRLLNDKGITVRPYLVGRKAVGFYRFRERDIAGQWTGFTDQPTYEAAAEIAAALIDAFLTPVEEGGCEEIHLVYTHFENMAVQRVATRRLLPVEIVQDEEPPPDGQPYPLYNFEPSPQGVLDALLPKYITNLVYTALLLSAASEHAARRRAMKSATDNADDLMKSLTRQANQARQAEITQEISEIVGGADALSSANAGS
ncbi:MAG: F0F1 ATP synthase subunit gamma [Actinomycetes bacterium]